MRHDQLSDLQALRFVQRLGAELHAKYHGTAGFCSSADYEIFENEIMVNRGLTRSDLKACIAVAEGILDASLFFVGVSSYQLLLLAELDHNKCVSDAGQLKLLATRRFFVGEFGDDLKSWAEMSRAERAQLVHDARHGLSLTERGHRAILKIV